MLYGARGRAGQQGYRRVPDAVAGGDGGAFLEAQHGPALAMLCANELRDRHPRILAAADAGDLAGVRWEAHALRGVAANFGLTALAGHLQALEAAARQQDAGGLSGPLGMLPAAVSEALAALGQDGA